MSNRSSQSTMRFSINPGPPHRARRITFLPGPRGQPVPDRRRSVRRPCPTLGRAARDPAGKKEVPKCLSDEVMESASESTGRTGALEDGGGPTEPTRRRRVGWGVLGLIPRGRGRPPTRPLRSPRREEGMTP
jgi:hypothetical protein